MKITIEGSPEELEVMLRKLEKTEEMPLWPAVQAVPLGPVYPVAGDTSWPGVYCGSVAGHR